MFPLQLKDLLDRAKARNLQVILAIDSNAHSHMWGSQSNPRGEAIEDLIAREGLDLANVGISPTFSARGTETSIDITLVKNIDLTNWLVESDLANFSDHHTIRFKVEGGPQLSAPTPNLSAGNWEKFRRLTELEISRPERISWDWIDDESKAIVDLLNSAVASSCPLSRPRKCPLSLIHI